MLEQNRLTLLGWVLGTLGLVVALGDRPQALPGWAWVCILLVPLAALVLGSGLELDGRTLRSQRAGRWMQLGAVAGFALLFLGAFVQVGLGGAPVWGLLLASLGLLSAFFVLRGTWARLHGRPQVRPWLQEVHPRFRPFEVDAPARDRSLGRSLRVVGVDSVALVLGGGVLVGLGVVLLTAGAWWGLLVVLSSGGVASLGYRQARVRWAEAVAPHRALSRGWLVASVVLLAASLALLPFAVPVLPFAARPVIGVAVLLVAGVLGWGLWARLAGRRDPKVWLAREGIVEQRPEATLLYPWEHVASADLVTHRGAVLVRVRLYEDDRLPFWILDTALGPDAWRRWVHRRSDALAAARALHGAPLLLAPAALDTPADRFLEGLRRALDEPGSVAALPSVLEDPPPVRLR